jgi:hypothetical protein
VANVSLEQDLLFTLARVDVLGIGQRTGRQRRIHARFVFAVRQRVEGALAHAEPPLLLVVRGPVRNEVRLIRQREDVLLQLGQRHAHMHGRGIVEHMQRVRPEVDDALPCSVLDVGVANGPLVGDGPVQNLGACRRFRALNGDDAFDVIERLANPGAGDAAADRIDLGRKGVQPRADARGA